VVRAPLAPVLVLLRGVSEVLAGDFLRRHERSSAWGGIGARARGDAFRVYRAAHGRDDSIKAGAGEGAMARLVGGSVLLAALVAAGAAFAQPYPNRPVKLIVPFPAGGPADLIARIIGQKLSEDFGKQFYVENHSGAGGNLGTGIGA